MKDRYPAYISFEVFEKVQAMLRDNRAEYVRLKSRDRASRILVPLRLAEMTYTSRSVR